MNDMLCHKKKESMSMVCYVIKKGVYVDGRLCYKKKESVNGRLWVYVKWYVMS